MRGSFTAVDSCRERADNQSRGKNPPSRPLTAGAHRMPSSADPPDAAGPSQATGPAIVGASDFLSERSYWFTRRARRKKIALIRLDIRNDAAGPAAVDLARARLSVSGRIYEAEKRDTIVAKLTDGACESDSHRSRIDR
jgi:hypothetical protein